MFIINLRRPRQAPSQRLRCEFLRAIDTRPSIQSSLMMPLFAKALRALKQNLPHAALFTLIVVVIEAGFDEELPKGLQHP